MSDSAAQPGSGDAALQEAVTRWSSDPAFAPVFAAPGGALLVLDAAGASVLHASPAARALCAAITEQDGGILAVLRLGDQLRRAAPPAAGTRSARIRFDPRGIARPTACLVARAGLAGGSVEEPGGDHVLLLAPTEPLPALRAAPRPTAGDARLPALPSASPPAPAAQDGGAAGEPVPERGVGTGRPGRLVWRSGADGVLASVSGVEPDIAACLAGRSWQALGESGEADGEALLSALSEQRTFRALPLTLRLEGTRDEIDLDVSGMPVARPNQPFAGFSGFGTERRRRVREPQPESAPEPAQEAPHEPERDVVRAPAREPVDNSETPASEAASDVSPSSRPEPGPQATSIPMASAAGRDDPDARPDPVPPASSDPVSRGAALSIHEHAAFREIARALGARFAGDEAPPLQDGTPSARRGALMAFPTPPANPGSAIDAAIVAALDRLPAGVLVHRDGATLYANRRLLELAGSSNADSLQAAEGLAPLFTGPAPDRSPGERGVVLDEIVSIKTEGGELRGLLVERSRVDWQGAPSELLLVRAAGTADPPRERIAQGLLRAREGGREREAQALLDHIEEGVAGLDEAGRLVALNQGATAVLSGGARELVGANLVDLFAPESVPAVTASLEEAREAGASAPREVVSRTRRAPVRLRIARLSSPDTPRFCATLRELTPTLPRALPPVALPVPDPEPVANPAASPVARSGDGKVDVLARVGREVRTPVNGILGHADAMLGEQFGPLGSERYHEYLREIRASGEHVLGLLDDLLHLAKIEAGRVALTFTDVALNEVVSNCIALMQPQAARDRIVVRTSLSPDLSPLVADERSMRQAALNVIANAIRFTEAGGQVIVSTTIAERGEIAFRVKDTGIGMTQEEIACALEPFRRDEAAVPRGGGTGLGLTLTKALVEANRGRFRITSRKNEGTLVEMLFPPPQARTA